MYLEDSAANFSVGQNLTRTLPGGFGFEVSPTAYFVECFPKSTHFKPLCVLTTLDFVLLMYCIILICVLN